MSFFDFWKKRMKRLLSGSGSDTPDVMPSVFDSDLDDDREVSEVEEVVEFDESNEEPDLDESFESEEDPNEDEGGFEDSVESPASAYASSDSYVSDSS